MLSDDDRRILGEIEVAITRESPELARALRRRGRLRRWQYDVLVGFGATTAILCWVLAEHGTFEEGALAASLTVLVAVARHHRHPYRLRWFHLRDDWSEPR